VEIYGMFYGQYEHSLDRKGRFIVPSKLRQILNERFSEKFIAARGLEKCISLYTQEGWDAIVEKVKTLPFMTGKDSRAFTRLLFSGAVECSLDKQGRILLPSNLREHAEITKDVVIAGVSSHIEVWSKERWTEYLDREGGEFENTAEKLMEFGI
jgi:MraZ protein